MKEFLKIMMRIMISIIGVGVLGFGGCVGCVKLIGNSNSCTWCNIDNIELRAHFDIPATEPGSNICIKDKDDGNSKTNYFKIRTDTVDMVRYVDRNSFKPVYDADMDLSVFGKFPKIPKITPENIQGYYYKSGHNTGKGKRTHWLAIVDKNSGDLWVYLKYKEVQPDSGVQ
ncbi:MAG: hypothetical protein LBE56_11625 [Tannerella sp.]|jgi:hypothetical protein|nr:hypothetical protein [Tannerella sp.]